MRPFLFAFAILAAGVPRPASSVPAPVTTVRVDPAALAAADRMLTAMGYDRMMQRTCDAMAAQMGPMLKKGIESKTGETVDDALITRLTKIETDFLRETLVNAPQIRKAYATLYASKFSVAELDHMAELYRDPVMRKWSEVAPELAAETMPLIQGVVESHRTDLEQKLASAVVDYYSSKADKPDS